MKSFLKRARACPLSKNAGGQTSWGKLAPGASLSSCPPAVLGGRFGRPGAARMGRRDARGDERFAVLCQGLTRREPARIDDLVEFDAHGEAAQPEDPPE